MKYSNLNLPLVLLMSSLAGQAIAHAPSTAVDQYPDAIAHPDQLFKQELASRMFGNLPEDQKALLAQAGAMGSQGFSPATTAPQEKLEYPTNVSPKEFLDMVLSDEMRASFSTNQIAMINNMVRLLEIGESYLPQMCFAPGTNPDFVYLTSQLLGYQSANDDSGRFQQIQRWTNTVMNGPGLTQGTPTTLTYSFALDGSFVPDIGLGSGSSTLYQWLNGLYSNTAEWQGLFHQVFQDWSDLIGTTYIYEPNDDGSDLSQTAQGISGVRGDIRICGFNFPFDGNSGVLAYNFFPQNGGDMHFDAFDTFYNNVGGESFRLRQVASHEHGHGLGMLHVCPLNQTVLMEPFFSTQFDGPQLDDVLNGLRHYGDNAEPNDNTTQATDLGTMSLGDTFETMDNLAIDDNSDRDYFKVTNATSVRIVFTVTPDAAQYIQGAQTQACDSGVLTNYNNVEDLQVTVKNSAGIDLITINAGALGQPETMIFDAIDTDDYYFVVDGSLGVNNVQRYKLDITLQDLSDIDPVLITSPPISVEPGVPFQFPVNVNPFSDILIPGSEALFYSINGGEYASIAMAPNGTNSFLATIPAFSCDEIVSYYISTTYLVAGEVTFPLEGSTAPLPLNIGDFIPEIVDDFESDQGWTVSGTVSGSSSGEWERGIPVGSANRGDPAIDADGSGSAFLTGNAPGNTDVDGGQTILTSPQYDVSTMPNAWVSYSRWFDNTGAGTGSSPDEDVFTVRISNNNGSSWTTLEIVGPDTLESKGEWFTAEFRISDYVNPTDRVRVQFIAEDILNSSVVEAGVDAFVIFDVACEDPDPTCIPDFNGDGQLDFFDISAFLIAFNAGDISADLNLDGLLNFFDISTFLQEYSAGCP